MVFRAVCILSQVFRIFNRLLLGENIYDFGAINISSKPSIEMDDFPDEKNGFGGFWMKIIAEKLNRPIPFLVLEDSWIVLMVSFTVLRECVWDVVDKIFKKTQI